jgi:predicted RNA-binding Zn-ribbon protein involved in translation (DUF1610 family)
VAVFNPERVHRLLDPGHVLVGWAALTLASLSLLWVVQRRAVNRTGATVCGSCGYNLQGLSGHTCPECGGDLRRRDGILRPGWPYPTERLARLVQWTILLPIAGLTITGLIAIFLQRKSAERDLQINLLRDPFAKVHLHATGEGYLRPVRIEKVTVELWHEVRPRRVIVEVNAKTLRYREPAASQKWSDEEIHGRAAEQWLAWLGLDGSSPEGRADAEELAAIIRSAAGDRDWYPAPARFRVVSKEASAEMPRRDPWFRLAAAAFWAATWLSGAIWILKRRPASRGRP